MLLTSIILPADVMRGVLGLVLVPAWTDVRARSSCVTVRFEPSLYGPSTEPRSNRSSEGVSHHQAAAAFQHNARTHSGPWTPKHRSHYHQVETPNLAPPGRERARCVFHSFTFTAAAARPTSSVSRQRPCLMLRALPRVARIAVQRPVLQSRRALVTKFSKVRRKPLAASASKLPAAAARAALAESWPLAMPPVRRV